jgi:hypothetical protein
LQRRTAAIAQHHTPSWQGRGASWPTPIPCPSSEHGQLTCLAPTERGRGLRRTGSSTGATHSRRSTASLVPRRPANTTAQITARTQTAAATTVGNGGESAEALVFVVIACAISTDSAMQREPRILASRQRLESRGSGARERARTTTRARTLASSCGFKLYLVNWDLSELVVDLRSI